MPANGQAMTEGLVIMARRRGAWTFSRGAAVALLALGLVACGETAAPTDPGAEITPPVPLSPTAGEIPEETFQATATITDEGLEPDRFAGEVGTAFQLVVEGDGSEHTLEIQELVAADDRSRRRGRRRSTSRSSVTPASWTSCLTAKLSGRSSGRARGGVTDS